ncbi:MAG: hypothetical protein WCT14_16830, partial [Treponemataceae bacterium]
MSTKLDKALSLFAYQGTDKGNRHMRTSPSLFQVSLFLLFLMPLTLSAEPVISRVDTYKVKKDDTMYQISQQVYSDDERNRGAHWLSIFAYNVEH